MRGDGYLYTGVGPGPRKLINLATGRDLHCCQNGGDDDLYLSKPGGTSQVVKDHLPRDLPHKYRRVLPNYRTCQMNILKYASCCHAWNSWEVAA